LKWVRRERGRTYERVKERERERERSGDEGRENSTLDEFDTCVRFNGRGVLPALLSL
jgi:hypothetical protein